MVQHKLYNNWDETLRNLLVMCQCLFTLPRCPLVPRPSKIPGRVPGHLEDVLLAEERYAKTHAVLWPSVEAPLWVSLAGASMGR